MEKEPKMGIDPKIKEEINKEGWEESAAVLIGKKEEMSQLLEKLETEGKTADLGTYIKLHKEITLPSSEITDEELKKEILDNRGVYWYQGRLHGEIEVGYFDKDGNYAKVEIYKGKIASLKSIPILTWENLTEELKKLDFTDIKEIKDETKRIKVLSVLNRVRELTEKYKEKIEKELTERKKEEFDF